MPTPKPTPKPTFTFFELHTPDLAAAKAFYGGMFDWTFKDMPVPGPRFALAQGDGLRGGMTEDARTHWLNYITVEDCAAAAEKAQRLGGKRLSERIVVPGRGSYFVIADPSGTPLALWQEQH